MSSKVINELTLKINADIAELKGALGQAKTEVSGFQSKMNDVSNSIKNAFSVYAIVNISKQLFQFGKEAVMMSKGLVNITGPFEALNKPDLLKNLQDATGGAVKNLDLMRIAVEAGHLHVPLEKLGGMLAYVRQHAKETGGSFQEMADKLVLGIGKNSPKALAQLGISTKDYQKELAKTGDMATALSNIMAESMEKSGKGVKTVSGIMDKWAVQWDNLKMGIGMLINNIIVKLAPIIDEIAAGFMHVWEVSSKWIIDTYNGFADVYNNSVAFRVIVEGIGLAFKQAWNMIKFVFNMIVDSIKGVGGQMAYVFNPKNWGKDFSKGLKEMQKENSTEFITDIKDFATQGAKNFGDTFENVTKGKMKHISSLMPDWLSAKNGSAFGSDDKADDGSGKVAKQKSWQKQLLEDQEYLITKMKINDALLKDAFKDMGELDLGDINPTSQLEEWKAPLTGFEIAAQHFKTSLATSFDLGPMITAAFEQVGNSLADVLTGGGMKSVFDAFLGLICDFMASFGKELITLGVAAVALEHMFKNPWLAIAAGVGLIALSKVAKNIAAKGAPKFAGGGIVPGYAYGGDRTPILANAGEMILNGAQQANMFKQLNGGGNSGGMLTCTVSGNNLLFVLDQARRKQGYSY